MLRIRRPFVISFFGIMLSHLLQMAGLDCLLWCAAAALVVLFLYFAVRRSPACKTLLILLICTLLSVTVFTLSDTLRAKEDALRGFSREITGTVTDISRDTDGGIRSAVLSGCTVDNTKIYSKIRIYTDEKAVFSYGDRLKLTADELFVSEGEGIFRYHSISDRCRLSCTYTTENSTVEGAESSFYSAVLSFRGYSAQKLRAALGNETYGISQALFTGSRDNVSPELNSAFRICGISHIFAVSGMHLSLWTGMFFIIFKRRARLSPVANILASLFVVFYIIFTGFSPSVLRAGIMLCSVFFGRILRTFIALSGPMVAKALIPSITFLLNSGISSFSSSESSPRT